MEFDSKRLLKLAGIPDHEPTAQVRSTPRPLTESARRAPRMSADEQKLRALIRREAGKMLQERASGTDVTRVQQRKSLTEAITMGFAGIGFGSNRGVLGGPMTSAPRFASLYESEVEEIDEGPDPDVEEGDASEDEIKKEADEAGEDD